jgi:hypothetical protein
MTDRWLRTVPNSMLPKKVWKALGGKGRRRSTVAETLALTVELISDKSGQPSDSGGSPGADVVNSIKRPAPELLVVGPMF